MSVNSGHITNTSQKLGFLRKYCWSPSSKSKSTLSMPVSWIDFIDHSIHAHEYMQRYKQRKIMAVNIKAGDNTEFWGQHERLQRSSQCLHRLFTTIRTPQWPNDSLLPNTPTHTHTHPNTNYISKASLLQKRLLAVPHCLVMVCGVCSLSADQCVPMCLMVWGNQTEQGWGS